MSEYNRCNTPELLEKCGTDTALSPAELRDAVETWRGDRQRVRLLEDMLRAQIGERSREYTGAPEDEDVASCYSTPPAPVATQQEPSTGPHARLCATCKHRNPLTICVQVASGHVPRWIAERGGYVNGAPCWQYRPQDLTREQAEAAITEAARHEARAICGHDEDPDPDPQRRWASVHAAEVLDVTCLE